jgi:4-diphosphocytidyl-2-C-methyl-D-erythritol kinase
VTRRGSFLGPCIPGSPNQGFSLRAPAKINWFLRIPGQRTDGYHDIISLMQCVALYDDLKFEHADSLNVACNNQEIPLRDNIVFKAASLLSKYASYRGGARVVLKKNIPVSAGLGGGSSDAAYTLLGLNLLWGLGLSKNKLSSIAIEIGSDVPFFLNGPAALVEGKGEKIKSLRVEGSIVMLLVNPRISVSTAWAYAAFDDLRAGELTKKPIDIKLFCQALNRKDFAVLGNMLANDLEEAVIERYPVVGEIKRRLIEMGALISAMSGSGPTVFGVFDSKNRAEKAADAMDFYLCRVVETLATVNSK